MSMVFMRVLRRLFLEEVVEAATDVAGPRRVGRGVALDRHTERERAAIVSRVLVGDPLGDRLGALEATARLEVGALAAGVERRPAVGTLLERRGGDRQDRAARPAPRDRALGEHVAASWGVGRRPRWWGGRSARLRARAPVTLLAILSVAHGR